MSLFTKQGHRSQEQKRHSGCIKIIKPAPYTRLHVNVCRGPSDYSPRQSLLERLFGLKWLLCAEALVKAAKALTIQQCVMLGKKTIQWNIHNGIVMAQKSVIYWCNTCDANWGVVLCEQTRLRNGLPPRKAAVHPTERLSWPGLVSHHSPCPTFSLQ